MVWSEPPAAERGAETINHQKLCKHYFGLFWRLRLSFPFSRKLRRHFTRGPKPSATFVIRCRSRGWRIARARRKRSGEVITVRPCDKKYFQKSGSAYFILPRAGNSTSSSRASLAPTPDSQGRLAPPVFRIRTPPSLLSPTVSFFQWPLSRVLRPAAPRPGGAPKEPPSSS